MSRCLVTAGAGFIGSHIMEALVRRGYNVVVMDDFSTDCRANLAPFLGGIRLIQGTVATL